MTLNTGGKMIDEINLNQISKISEKLKKGSYYWGYSHKKKTEKLEKKKLLLGTPSFEDKIVQEMIRIILSVIYEPVFQSIETNHGFRPKRNTETAIKKIQKESQGTCIALKGNIRVAYKYLSHSIMIKILSQKINDKKFLKLVETCLKQNIEFKNKTTQNLIETFQEGINSSIFFNIYSHEFDIIINSITQSYLTDLNKKEKRKGVALTRLQNRIQYYLNSSKVEIKKLIKEKQLTGNFNYLKFIELRDFIRKRKKEYYINPKKNLSRVILIYSYCRYADD